MRKIIILIICCFSYSLVSAQGMYKPSAGEISTLPDWAKEMYRETPNVWRVDSLYRNYYEHTVFEKTYHTQYYKRWRRNVDSYIDAKGFVGFPDERQREMADKEYQQKMKASKGVKSGQWQVMGPVQSLGNNGQKVGSQTNVYSIDQCLAVPEILYCGTEPGEVYKSTDHGQSWMSTSMDYDMGGGVTAVEVDPSNPDIVFAGSGYRLMRSDNGGNSWNIALQLSNLGVNEILIVPSNPQIVMAATNLGLYRSSDGGLTFSQLFSEKTYDLKLNPLNDQKVYCLRNNPTLIRAEFFMSSDMGASWTLKDQGWYSSMDPDRNDGGARLGVTPADTSRIYAYLIGEAKTDDYGFIGIYRSDDGGETWYLPNPPAGGPYTSAHPNTAYGTPSWTYHQGFYNCALMVDNENPDHLLIGGLNLWRSEDGAHTFAPQAGYQGSVLQMHVDMQDFRAMNGEYWITNDGGIYWSDNFFTGSNLVKTTGVHGSDYWGFGSGWNEDVLVGGLYHNGNLAWHENYNEGEFLSLGGGEAPTGYVNPSENRRTYFSDIGGKLLPEQMGDPIINFTFGMYPNETYWSAESSELEFHPSCYNIMYLGKENKLWKSVNGGTAFNLVHEFGPNTGSQVKYIEISRSNPQVIYLSQQPATGTLGSLWKTTDGGANWSLLTKPSGNSRKILIALSPENENLVWIAYPQGGNNAKIYKSINGGNTWTNLYTPELNGEEIHSICQIGGTQGGIYLGTQRTVYYRNDTMTDWVIFNDALPTYFNTDIIRPFYRDGKLRIASYGKGIWESPFYEAPQKPVAQIMVDKLEEVVHCATDTFYFDCYSMLNHLNATWQWTFQGGAPSSSSLRNPKVVFNTPGNHLVTLTVTDGNGIADTDTLTISLSNYTVPTTLNEGFEGIFPPLGWEIFNPDQDATWSVSNSAGGFGWSARSGLFDNFNNDCQGRYDDFRFSINLSQATAARLVFDVAYAKWGGQYSDTLEIHASIDCGQTYSQLYEKGGDILATAPDNQDFFYPNFSQWRSDTVDLADFLGQDDLTVAFRNIGRYGNALYIDNPRVITPSGVNELQPLEAEASVYPNPVVAGSPLFLATNMPGSFILCLYDTKGKLIFRNEMRPGQNLVLPEEKFAPGIYQYQLTGSNIMKRGKLVVMKGR